MTKKKVEGIIAKAEELFKDFRHRSKLLRFLSDKRLQDCNEARLYELKGITLRRSGRRMPKNRKLVQESIKAFTEAIQLEPKIPSHYIERAKAWGQLRDRRNALKDLDAAVGLDTRDPVSYLARAGALQRFRRFEEAKRDFASAIRLDPKNPKAYDQRAKFWRALRDRRNEIKDIETSLRLNPAASPEAHVELGDLYHKEGKYPQAFEQFNLALDMDPAVELWTVDYVQVNLFNVIAPIRDSRQKKIYEACIPIPDLLNSIRDLTDPVVTDGYEDFDKPVVHFTKLSVADILLSSDDNKFRFYHVSYMNDPEEGKILLQVLNDPAIEESFNNGSRNEESNFYLGSFLPAMHADELVMWRTYGKDENDSEAKGCSIVIGRGFFDDEPAEVPVKPEEQADSKTEKTSKDKKDSRDRYDTNLHKVIYYNKSEHKILGNDGAEIKKVLRRLRTLLSKIISRFKERDEKNSAINRAVDAIVYSVITEIRYYFKSSDYAYENEERLILFAPPKSALVKIEDGKTLPKRLYVESKNPIRKHIQSIVLGPRVEHPERWGYLRVKMIKDRNEIEIVKSSCKFQ